MICYVGKETALKGLGSIYMLLDLWDSGKCKTLDEKKTRRERTDD